MSLLDALMQAMMVGRDPFGRPISKGPVDESGRRPTSIGPDPNAPKRYGVWGNKYLTPPEPKPDLPRYGVWGDRPLTGAPKGASIGPALPGSALPPSANVSPVHPMVTTAASFRLPDSLPTPPTTSVEASVAPQAMAAAATAQPSTPFLPNGPVEQPDTSGATNVGEPPLNLPDETQEPNQAPLTSNQVGGGFILPPELAAPNSVQQQQPDQKDLVGIIQAAIRKMRGR